jgi:hypothetical protein
VAQEGFKVDLDASSPAVIEALKQGRIDLNNPATALALLKLNSVAGVTGLFNQQGTLRSVGRLRAPRLEKPTSVFDSK